MSPGPSAATRVFAVLGRPVAHSLSPAMHGAAFAERGLDAVYVALECGGEDLRGLVRGLARAGGGGNVTLPHKERALDALDARTGAVERTGACNTFWAEDGAVVGDNTDVAGFRAAARVLLEAPAAGATALVLGAGGAARAAVVGLLDEGASSVLLHNRTAARARSLARELGEARVRVLEGASALRGLEVDLVVQATRLGLAEADPLPLDLDTVGRVGAVLDLVYAAAPTALVRQARARGIPADDGREMLLQQGAAAFARWFGDPVPVEAMRSALGPRGG